MAKPKRPRTKKPELVPFVACFIENERAGLRCSCTFPATCDGSRLIHCQPVATCDCLACPKDEAEHVTGCEGCEQCNRAECGTCGARSVSEPAATDSTWYCSPECSRKAFTVAS